jgi:peptidoglycan/LPS O-acetylase OafA/YrhL
VPATLPSTGRRGFLPEVQALRALAVSLVVGYHYWPDRLPGGYVGVDVFFVISGFLITSHLDRELRARGTISLPAFYARRARRLLPAALLVLAVSTVTSWAFLPVGRWATTAREVLASTVYAENWLLAGQSVDYSALTDAASPVQHFWSLAVEEQFYLGWPALVLALAWLARRTRSAGPHRLLLTGVLTVTAASLLCSVLVTAASPAVAYFITPTRVWELGAGASLALWAAGRTERTGGVAAAAARWLGLGAVLGSAVLLSGSSPFPGYLALLPVLGTAAVIGAGDTTGDPLHRLVVSRPVRFLGDHSYSLYLWHWPVLVIAPFVLDQRVHGAAAVWLVAVSVALAWLTKTAVEDPTLRWQSLVSRPALAAGLTAVTMAAVAGLAGLQLYDVARHEGAARADLAAASGQSCFGAAALPRRADCPAPFGPPVSPTLTPDDRPWFEAPDCPLTPAPVTVYTCRFGTTPPSRRVALVGDSHAEQWRAALHQIARQENWELVEVMRGGCPATAAWVVAFAGAPVETEDCRRWGDQVDQVLAADPPDQIVTSAYASSYTFAADGEESLQAGADGFERAWSRWAALGSEVLVLEDIPTTGGRQVPECVALHPQDPLPCARPRAAAFPPDALTAAARHADGEHVRRVDLTEHFCDDATCYAVVGGAQVYFDANHMSAQFSRTLAPFLLEEMNQATSGP